MFHLAVVKDDPGQRLVLQESQTFNLPPAAGIGCLAAAVLAFVVGPFGGIGVALFQSGGLTSALLGALLDLSVAAVIVVVAWRLLNSTRGVVLLAADAAAGDLRIEDSALFGWSRRARTWRLGSLTGATVEAAVGSGRADVRTLAATGGTRSVALRLRLRFEGPDGQERSEGFRLVVRALDKREEVADLALRLAAACQMGYYEVTRNDPRQVTVELRSVRSGLMAAVPVPEGRASYAEDRVADPARQSVAEERLPLFDPQTFPSEFRVAKWEPGVLVRFEKRARAGVGCLPFVLLILAGPAGWFWMTGRGDAEARFAVALFGLIFGLAIGGAALLVGLMALPRRVSIDWLAGRIRLWRPGKRREILTGDVAAVELTCQRYKGSKSPPTYRCAVKVLHRDRESGGERLTELVETRSFTSDPDTPYGHALPLATELAQALNVPRRIVDYV